VFVIRAKNSNPVDAESSICLSLPGNFLPCPLELAYDGEPLTLAEFVQPVYRLCDMMCDYTTSKPGLAERIPCKGGCSKCCSYLVSISIPEAIEIFREVEGFPTRIKNHIKRNSISVCRRILDNKPPRDLFEGDDISLQNQNKRLSEWYQTLNISCPFLYDDHCLIYEFRPLSCRQYFVTGPACDKNSRKTKIVPQPVNLTHTIGLTVSQLQDDIPQSILLPFVFAWCDDNPDILEKSYPASELASLFSEELSNSSKYQPIAH
jgi:Fe-S-cluster containining protein